MMKKIITLIMCLVCCCSYAFLYEGNGGKWLSEDIAVSSGGGGEVIKYEIVYKDYDGTVLGSFVVNRLESTPELEEEPSRPGFIFVGWSPSISSLARNDATYIAQYEMIYSEGLAFELSDDGNFYYVAGIGTHGNDTVINIPPTHEGLPVEKIKYQAFKSNTKMTDVYIPDSVNEIGSYSFQSCNNLANVTGCEGLNIVGSYSFSGCTSLTDFPFSSLKEIHQRSFENCHSLTHIDIGTEILDSPIYIGQYAFLACKGLLSANFGDNVATISSCVLQSCTSLKTVHLGDNVCSIGDNFLYGDTNMEYINIPPSLHKLGQFNISMPKATGPLIIPEHVTEIAYFGIDFGGEKIVINCNQININGVTSYGSNAIYANNVKELYVKYKPKNVSGTGSTKLFGFSNVDKVYFHESVFLDWLYYPYCYSFNRIGFGTTNIKGGEITTVATQTASFYNVYAEGDDLDITDGVLYGFKTGSDSDRLYIPEGVTSLAPNAFANHSMDFAEIFIPETVQSIGDGAFDNASITRIIFEGHPASISGFDGATVGRVFYPYYSSYKDTRGNDITESLWVLNNERTVLGGCTPIEFVGFGGDSSGYGSMVNNTFTYQNSSIYSAGKKYAYYIPASGKMQTSDEIYVTKGFSGQSSGNKMIEGGASEGTCVKVILPDTIEQIHTYFVFLLNKQLREFELPRGLQKFNIPSSGSTYGSHFRGTLLDHIDMPRGMTGIIPSNCFADMASLTSIIIPSGITAIGNSGIGRSANSDTAISGLQTITYLGNPPTGNYQCRYLDGITIRYLDTNASAWASYTALDTFGGATNVTWEMITEDDI